MLMKWGSIFYNSVGWTMDIVPWVTSPTRSFHEAHRHPQPVVMVSILNHYCTDKDQSNRMNLALVLKLPIIDARKQILLLIT